MKAQGLFIELTWPVELADGTWMVGVEVDRRRPDVNPDALATPVCVATREMWRSS